MKSFIKILCIFAIVGIGISSSYAEKVRTEPFPISFTSVHNLKICTMNILKDIPDYEGLYAATKDGRIFSYPKPCSSKKGIFLKQQISITKHNRTTPHKQLLIGLYKNKKNGTIECRSKCIHKLSGLAMCREQAFFDLVLALRTNALYMLRSFQLFYNNTGTRAKVRS